MSGHDPRKRACDELAELLSTPDGLRTARLLQLSEALEPRGRRPEPGNDHAPPDDRTIEDARAISIWRPRRRGDELIFERPEPQPFGDHYARHRTLVAAKQPGRLRICLFGESVAAGYLYAPHLTPAQVLDGRLRAARGGAAQDVCEVVDLARTNETLDSMAQTIERSSQLSPDFLVIFAGNNWNLLETPDASPYVPSVRSRQRFALALRRAGLGGVAERARRDLTAKVEKTFARIAELASHRATPVIVVVPEVNLADWQDRQPVAWLPGDGSRRWHLLYCEAVEHLGQGRCQAALEAAGAMIELDAGQCPTSHRLRAGALAGLGRLKQARQACEAEVESGRYATMCFLSAPRAARSVAELLRRVAARHGFVVVDLPRLFAEDAACTRGLPGRRLFLDYCHLSAEGIELATSAIAGAVLERSGLRVEVATAGREMNLMTRVEPAVEALARLGAAIHGAHRLLTTGDKPAYLERWCREALAADPTVAGAMRDLLAARCAPCSAVLTAAQQRNLASPHRLLPQHGWRWHHLDVELIEAICSALEHADHPVRDQVEVLLLRHHAVDRKGVVPKGVDLSRAPYLWEPLERFYPEAMATRGGTGRATVRSPWPEASFVLIAGGDSNVALELTARLPATSGVPGTRRGEITVRLDGHDVTSVPVEESWSRHHLRLSCHDLQRTIHRVTLVWPALPANGDQEIENAIHRLENGIEADLYPVFGEVFSLIARAETDFIRA